MYKYEITIYWDDQDRIYVADVPELPGCSAHGDTYDDALKNIKEAIKLWIDTANEFGDPCPNQRGIGCCTHNKQLAQRVCARTVQIVRPRLQTINPANIFLFGLP